MSSKFLTFKNYHTFKLLTLEPESLKKDAKSIAFKNDREEIKHTTILNHIAKSLGFSGGFSGYKKAYYSELLPFMKENGLERNIDLISRRDNEGNFFINLSLKKVADRIFHSNLPVPQKIFTGYNFDFRKNYYDPYLTYQDEKDKLGLPKDEFIFPLVSLRKIYEFYKKNKDENITLKHRYRDNSGVNQVRSVKDIILGVVLYSSHMSSLIGDMLVSPQRQENFINLHLVGMDSGEKDEYLFICKYFAQEFREVINLTDDGWVEVVRFNDNLAFLKGDNGEYDFIFSNLRERDFAHSIDFGFKISYVPSCIKAYSNSRWKYFDYKGWEEKDQFLAFDDYLQKLDNKSISDDIQFDDEAKEQLLVNYLRAQVNHKQIKSTTKLLPGFYVNREKLENLAISNAITIKQFKIFLSENHNYHKDRYEYSDNDKDWYLYNQDEDESLPAAVSWYDALAYMNWFEKEHGVCVRLLNENEFIENFGPCLDQRPDDFDDLVYINSQDGCFHANAPYVFKENLPISSLPSGLNIINSGRYCEWLFERKAIFQNGGFHSFSHALDSTGAYKKLKICFRICYELVDDSDLS